MVADDGLLVLGVDHLAAPTTKISPTNVTGVALAERNHVLVVAARLRMSAIFNEETETLAWCSMEQCLCCIGIMRLVDFPTKKGTNA